MRAKDKPIQTVYIAGARWSLWKLTSKLSGQFSKYLGLDPEKTLLRGFCDSSREHIYVRPGQHKEDAMDTLLHEGLHAMLWEFGTEHKLSHIQGDEKTISILTSEILGFLKQTGAIE